MSGPLSQFKFLACDGCINHDLDPFRCGGCRNGNRFEGADTSPDEELHSSEEDMTFDEFRSHFSGDME